MLVLPPVGLLPCLSFIIISEAADLVFVYSSKPYDAFREKFCQLNMSGLGRLSFVNWQARLKFSKI